MDAREYLRRWLGIVELERSAKELEVRLNQHEAREFAARHESAERPRPVVTKAWSQAKRLMEGAETP